MTDKTERLRQTLQQLHDELSASDAAETSDPQVRAMLEEAIQDINVLLESPEKELPQKDEEASVVDRLSEATRHFEETHPNLSATIGRLADILSQMGI